MANTFTCNTQPGVSAPGNTFWSEGGVTGKRRSVLQGIFVADGTKGALANDLPASVFGLTVIEEIVGGIASNNASYIVLQPAYDYKSVIGFTALGTAANVAAGTYALTVKGY